MITTSSYACSLEGPEYRDAALKLGGRRSRNGARIEARRFGLEGRSRSSDRGQSRECGSSEMRQWRSALSFYSTCTAPSVVRAVPLSVPIIALRSEAHHKDRK